MDRPEVQTVADIIAMRAAQDPTRTALVCPDDHAELTHADINVRAEASAAVFSNAGLTQGTKLAVMMTNGARFATCLFGAWRLGAIVVPIDPMLKGPDARDLIKASRAAALAVDERRLVELSGLLGECDSLKIVFAAGQAPAGTLFRDFDASMAAAVEAKRTVDHSRPSPHDPAIEAYRLHTDSLEAVPRTHEALSRDGAQLAERLALTTNDHGICYIPLGHSDGTAAFVAATMSGSTLVIPERFDARRFWELAAAQRATWLALVPTQFLDLQFAGPPANTAHKGVRVVMVSGSAVTANARAAFVERFGVDVAQRSM
jgi:acyl-CoA synthetase (AMP-forming)/AMP-acid ligase II